MLIGPRLSERAYTLGTELAALAPNDVNAGLDDILAGISTRTRR